MRRPPIAAVAAISLVLWLAACGLPNPYEIQSSLTPPQTVEARYDGVDIVLRITGFHTPTSSPDFSGYNIYWDRLNTAQTIMTRLAYGDNLFKPSVNARPGEGLQTVRVPLSQWWWSNTATGVVTREKFNVHDSYFIIVTAWAGRTRTESASYTIAEVRIPKWLTNQTNVDDIPYTNDGPGFTVSGNQIYPKNGSSIQLAGWAPSWTNLFPAPLTGYGSVPVPLLLSNVYYLYRFSDTTNYAKLWCYDHIGTNLLFHWAVLQGSPLL